MTIEYKDSKRIVKLSSDVVETPTYTANYDDTNTWTKTGTKVTVNETVSGKVNWNFSSNYTSAENHLETTPLGFTLDNEKWVCDFEFNASDFDNSAETFLVVFQENAGDFISTSGDGLACAIYANKTVRLWKKDGSTHSIDSNSNAITIATGKDYYARFSRTSATVIKFELFTDSARTVHVSGSPITFTFSETIQGLDNLTHCGRSDNVGSTRTYNVSLDNLKIWNGVTSVSSKPTNVQDNSLLVEKDTARRYWFTAESENTKTVDDDFSDADNWTDSDSTIIGVNTTTDVLDFKEKDGNFDEVSYYAITALGTDANFVLRFDVNVDTILQTGNTDSIRTLIGISSDNDIPTETARDEVGIIWRVTDTINKFYAFTADGIALPTSGTDFATTPSTTGGDGSGNYYVEIIGDSGTYTFKLFSDSTYDTLIESESITDAGITGLDNIVIRSSTLTTTNNQARGYINNVKFYDGVTSAIEPATWNNPYGDYIFTFNNDQTGNAAQTYVYVDTANSWWYAYSGANASTSTGQYIDLGSELSDDWTMIFKVISNTDGNTASLNAIIGLFLSNNTGTSYTADAHDFVSVWFNTDSSSRRNIRHSYGVNLVSNSGSGNAYLVDNTGAYGGDTLPDGTDITLYCVLNKSGTTTTAKLYTDKELTNQYGATATNTSVSSANLRYLKILSRAAGGSDNQVIIKVQSVQIKDGDANWTPKWIEG